jgi:glycosyltransferase involved in cell wall biosynthesis
MSNASSISDGSRPLLEHLDRFAASHGNEPLTVHFDSSDASCLADILARPFVRSVVLTRRDEAAAAAYPGRVGWLNFADNDYAEPTMAGTTLWRWKQHFPLSAPAILTYQEHGVRRFALATDMLATMPLLGPDEELKRSRRRERPTTPSYLRKLAPLRTYAQSLVEELNWSRRFSGLASGAPDRPEEAGASGILLVTQTLLAGGSERQVVNTALGLSRRTSEPVGILCAAGAAKADRFHQWRLADSNVLVTDLPARPSTPLPPALDARLAELWVEIGPSDGLIDTIIRLTAELIARKPRVVHAWLDAINIAAGFAAMLAGVPRIVLSTRSLSPLHYPFLQPYMRPGYRHLRRIEGVQIVSNSEAGARDYARWLKVLPRSISVIRNGIDAAEIDAVTTEQIDAYRTKIGLARHTPVVGGVFRLYEEKRPLLWAEVAAVLAKARPDVAFLIVGDGPMREEVRKFAEREGFSQRLHMPGAEPTAAVAIAAMTCLLLTSRVEGLPNVLLEAQAAGVPVVTSDVGGAVEATEHRRCGWVVSGRDPRRYGDRILAVLGDADWRDNARHYGRRLIADRFGLDRMIDETVDLYGAADVRQPSSTQSLNRRRPSTIG